MIGEMAPISRSGECDEPGDDAAPALGKPPKRANYAKGKRGREKFQRERADWYFLATGHRLAGNVERQNYDFDRVARRYRAYSDYRAEQSYQEERRAHNELESRVAQRT